MDHLISLSVGTDSAEDHAQTFQDLSELAANLGVSHKYVSVSSSLFADDDPDEIDDAGCTQEHLYHDDQTLTKARLAIAGMGFTEKTSDELVNALLNAGILLRERTPTPDKE